MVSLLFYWRFLGRMMGTPDGNDSCVKVDKLTIERIFDHTERLEAPLFQRPYVWTEDENWVPLWESIRSVAERRLAKQPRRPHFLGAIVLDQLTPPMGKLHARQIIDGQQRL